MVVSKLKNIIYWLASSRLWKDYLESTFLGYYVHKIGSKCIDFLDGFQQRRRDFLVSQYPLAVDNRTKILLIQVPLPANRRHKRVVPLGISNIASFLLEMDPELNVAILDAHVHNLEMDQILKEIGRCKWDIIGISYWTVQKKFATSLSNKIKASNSCSLLIHGGVHPSICPEESLQTADLCVLSEGEEAFGKIVEAYRNREPFVGIEGVAFIDDSGALVCNPKSAFLDVDTLPMPAIHLLHVEDYSTPLHITGGRRWPIISSRGCPYNCSYCVSPIMWDRKVRFRNPSLVVAEMKHIIDNYGIDQFHFWDDNFTINKEHTEELCREIIKEKLDIKWVCLDRAELLNKHKSLLPLMKEAGCIGVEVGLESANPDTFLYINKDQDIVESRSAINNLQDAGIVPLYTCMAFNPGESIVGYYLQKEFLDAAQEGYPWHNFFHPLPFPVYIGQFATPYPGTKYNDDIDKTSIRLLDDDEDLFHHQINTVPLSLLHDVPCNQKAIGGSELSILLLATKAAFYRLFPGHDSPEDLTEKLCSIGEVYLDFVSKCDGISTVDQIALTIMNETKLSRTYCYRLCSFATYILAQIGFIRSALNHLDLDVKPKAIQIPEASKLEVQVAVSRLKDKFPSIA